MTARAQPKARFKLEVDGKDISAAIDPRLCSLSLTEKRAGEADQLDLVLSDQDGKLAIPNRGAKITLSLGWEGQALINKGTFKVDSARHSGAPDVVTISARSADFTAELRTRRERSWRDTTLGAVLEEIAGGQSLTPRIDADLAAKPVDVLAQSRESDSQFLARLGRKYDAAATVKAGCLIFSPLGAGKSASGAALPAFALTRASGDQHEWSVGERDGAYTGVSASWHSVAGATRHTVRAGAAGKVRHLKKVYGSQADAKQAAEGELSRVKRGGGEFSLNLAIGRPDLYPERQGTVTGFKSEIDGKWNIKECRHELTGDGGLSTALQMEQAV